MTFHECPEYFFIGDEDEAGSDAEEANVDHGHGELYTLEWCSGLTYVQSVSDGPSAGEAEVLAAADEDVEGLATGRE